MQPEIKLVISHNNIVIQTVNQELSEQGFVKSIEDFQIIANATMTKLIENSGDSGEVIMEEDDDNDNEDEEEDEIRAPKKKKK